MPNHFLIVGLCGRDFDCLDADGKNSVDFQPLLDANLCELVNRSNRILKWNDRSLTLSELAREFGMLPGTLSDRLDYGWSLEKALTTPVRKRSIAR